MVNWRLNSRDLNERHPLLKPNVRGESTAIKNREIWMITEKLFFGFFLFCLFSFFVFSPFLVPFCFFVCSLLEGLRVRWGGPGGGVFFFAFFAFNRIKPVFGPQKGHFCLFFSVCPSFSLVFFPPSFSLSLSLSLSSSFLSSIFFSFLFCFLMVLVFLYLSFFFLVCLLLFHEKNSINLILKFVCHQSFCFLVFCLLFSFKLLFLIFVCFLILSFVFGSTSEKSISKTPIFGQQRGCNKTFFKEPLFFYVKS